MISEQAREAVDALNRLEWISCDGRRNPVALQIVQSVIDAERANNKWKLAVDHYLSNNMLTADQFATPIEAVKALIDIEQRFALDPAISADARALIDAERERCAGIAASFDDSAPDNPYSESARVIAGAIRGADNDQI